MRRIGLVVLACFATGMITPSASTAIPLECLQTQDSFSARLIERLLRESDDTSANVEGGYQALRAKALETWQAGGLFGVSPSQALTVYRAASACIRRADANNDPSEKAHLRFLAVSAGARAMPALLPADGLTLATVVKRLALELRAGQLPLGNRKAEVDAAMIMAESSLSDTAVTDATIERSVIAALIRQAFTPGNQEPSVRGYLATTGEPLKAALNAVLEAVVTREKARQVLNFIISPRPGQPEALEFLAHPERIALDSAREKYLESFKKAAEGRGAVTGPMLEVRKTLPDVGDSEQSLCIRPSEAKTLEDEDGCVVYEPNSRGWGRAYPPEALLNVVPLRLMDLEIRTAASIVQTALERNQDLVPQPSLRADALDKINGLLAGPSDEPLENLQDWLSIELAPNEDKISDPSATQLCTQTHSIGRDGSGHLSGKEAELASIVASRAAVDSVFTNAEDPQGSFCSRLREATLRAIKPESSRSER